MLPVSAWPPSTPGARLSPFGWPRSVNVGNCPFILRKGAWIVSCGSNSVQYSIPQVGWGNPANTPGTGYLPGQVPPPPPAGSCVPAWQRWDDWLEAWRAWQRQTGINWGPMQPQAGRQPPNWFGWFPAPGQVFTLVPPGASGTVLADGQNVRIVGSGCATITEVFSV